MKNRLGFLVVFYAVVACITLLAFTCAAQVRYGIVVGPARDSMQAHWNRTIEQAYCVERDTVFALDGADLGDSVYVIGSVTPATNVTATADSISFSCLKGHASVHTHPGQTTPYEMTDCNPSHKDWDALEAAALRYNVVQCGPTQFVFFFAVLNPVKHKTVFTRP